MAAPYKLLPLSEYKDLTNSASNSDIHQNQITDHDRHTSTKRSVGQIQKDFVNSITEGRDTPRSAQDHTTKGHGSSVSWIHTDPSILPQHSHQSRLEQSFKNYSDLLESKKIPLHLKIPLLEYFNRRHENTKREKTGITDEDDDEDNDEDERDAGTHYKFQSDQGILQTLSIISHAKRRFAHQLLIQLSKYPTHIRWDVDGKIIKPAMKKNNSVNDLKTLLEIILYANRGNLIQFDEVRKILFPILPKIRNYIQNIKLLNFMERGQSTQHILGVRKKKKKKQHNNSVYQALF